MRIIAGEFGGRRIQPPKKGSPTRPTLDRVKESLFDIISRRLKGARVLDLCAGTGALGLECLSRGSAEAIFIENQRGNVKIIQENIESLQVSEKCTVIAGELPYALGRLKGAFDVVFFDPPYEADELVEETIPRLSAKGLIKKGGLLIVERDRRSNEIKLKGFTIHRRHRIGDTELWFLEPGRQVKDDEPASIQGDDE